MLVSLLGDAHSKFRLSVSLCLRGGLGFPPLYVLVLL